MFIEDILDLIKESLLDLYKNAVLEIEFYDDPSKMNDQGLVWVSIFSKEHDPLTGAYLSGYFIQLLGKVLYNLGSNSPPASMLLARLAEAFSSPITKTTNISTGENYAFKIIEKQKSPRKSIKATFYTHVEKSGKMNDLVKTRFSHGGEGYYAPMAVFAFLQYIIDLSTPAQLTKFYNLTYKKVYAYLP